MKKNILLVILVLFLCSGCSVEYHLDVDKDLKENVKIIAVNDVEKEEIASYKQFLPINVDIDEESVFQKKYDDIEYYKKVKKNDSIQFSYSHDIKSFSKDMLSYSCYKYITAMYTNKMKDFMVSTSNDFLCFDRYDNLEEVKVVVSSKYKLKKTNADLVEHHKYTWNIKRGDTDNHLYLLLDVTKKDLNLLERILEGDYTNIFTVSIFLSLVGYVIYSFIKKKGEKRNRL